MIRSAIAVAVSLALAGCGTTTKLTEAKIEVREVKVPVPVTCRPTLPKKPDYPDTEAVLAAVPDVFVAAKVLLAGRKLRIAREQALEAALSGCAGTAPKSAP